MSESLQTLIHTFENGIHEFVVHDFTRTGADEFVAAIVAMNHSAEAGLPILMDSSRGTLPVGYLVARFRVLYPDNPKPQQPFKIAILHQPSVITSMMSGMMRAFSYTRVRLFKEHERAIALDWLRQKIT